MNTIQTLLSQLKKYNKHPLDYVLDLQLIEPSDSDDEDSDYDNPEYPEIHLMMEGPPDTPYEETTFKLRLLFNKDYPTYPPTVYFVTKCYHPNVSDVTGRVCVNLLDEEWNRMYDISIICYIIFDLLQDPNCDSALNDSAARDYRIDDFEDFKATVQSYAEDEYKQ